MVSENVKHGSASTNMNKIQYGRHFRQVQLRSIPSVMEIAFIGWKLFCLLVKALRRIYKQFQILLPAGLRRIQHGGRYTLRI